MLDVYLQLLYSKEELLEFSYDTDRGVIELRRGMTQPWH